ncbi:hypothetical protein DEDE109153_03895 [Deinococcus deserti]|uniref:PEGA domain-containing protein n=1 Tax=Deinococcus deserti (strain DSM 17065 / CIP 109153 / LMG 22923 / VCD115) TaxID=546414 RepID=C1D0M3_DEIDV|nr:hypothetical protein [Deinococcus deserti]ACO45397.2 hypothetical protein Deide_05590 [Deinococcus deserti VCD115]
MKPIGPYVAARDLSGAQQSVRTLHATDRLTGMPVLLHLLPGPLAVPELPDHPALLPFSDHGVYSGQAYLVSELPLHAQPASDPLLAARGALLALDALHSAGLVHGGVGPSQLWSVDGEVVLAGAGLPWHAGQASAQTDLRDLVQTLDTLGGLPARLAPLRDAPGTLSARDALDRLRQPAKEVRPAALRTKPAPTAQLPDTGPPAEPRLHDGSPIVLGEPDLPAPEPHPQSRDTMAAETAPAVETIVIAASPPSAPAIPASPAGHETPQERRRRENEARRAQAIQDAQAGARRKAERLRAQAEEQRAAVPEPIRIGFTEGAASSDADLPEWTPEPGAGDGSPPAPRLQMQAVERLPASLRRVPEPVVPETAELEAAPEPGISQEPQDWLQPTEPGRLPGRRVAREPIRIGWDEDESWRVVREPEPEPGGTPLRSPRWLLPLVAALLLIVAAVWAARVVAGRADSVQARTQPPASAAAKCCDVRFAVQGGSGKGAELFVVNAPEDANLTPGQDLGKAPGVVRFPVRGQYRLRVVADGYSPATLNLTVPRTSPVNIALGQ